MYYDDKIIKRYDIFCDASGDNRQGTICSGCAVIDLDSPRSRYMYTVTSYESSSNRGEILAIWLGISKAIEIKNEAKYDVKFRIFSDSRLSIYGLKHFAPDWIKNQIDGVWYTNSKKIVNNQDVFKAILGLIIDNQLYVEMYAQKAHVQANAIMSAESYFENNNDVSLGELGVTSEYICANNNLVDNFTRSQLLVADPLGTKKDNPFLYGFRYYIDLEEVDQYLDYIQGGYNKYKEAVTV